MENSEKPRPPPYGASPLQSIVFFLTRPAELQTAGLLAANHGRGFTSWADACRSPTLAGVAGTGSNAPAAKVVGDVSLQSPVSPPGGNALGYAECCGGDD